MKTLTNRLVFTADREALGSQYDFFQLKTSEKYIARGARALNLNQDDIKILSIVFDYGISAFFMTKKYSVPLARIQGLVQDDKLRVSKVDVASLSDYILAKLLLNALSQSDYEETQFDNLTGKLLLFRGEWIPRNRKHLNALEMDIVHDEEDHLFLNPSFKTFTRLDTAKKKDQIKNYPTYEFGTKGTLRRCFEKKKPSEVYILKGIDHVKAELGYLDFGTSGRKPKVNKTDLVFQTLDNFNRHFCSLAKLAFGEREIEEHVQDLSDEHFFEGVKMSLKKKPILFVNKEQTEEDAKIFERFQSRIQQTLPYSLCQKSDEIQADSFNIVFIHDQSYYAENDYPDPYKTFKRNQVIQCLTKEDALAPKKDAKPTSIDNTILKELAIKNDLIYEREISLDDWSRYGFQGDMTFGMLNQENAYFLTIDKDGKLKTIAPLGISGYFKEQKYTDLRDVMLASGKKECSIIQDDKGNVVTIIGTKEITLPYPEILETRSRSAKAKNDLLAGLIGVNFYQTDSTTFYYSAGNIHNLRSSLPKGVRIYKVVAIKGENFFKQLLLTMSVPFVRFNSFTVQPYPMKYLREWVEMETGENPETKKK